MDKTPFSVYDFFAYLSSGGIVVITADYLYGNRALIHQSLPIQIYVLLIVVSYVAGQIIAHLSSVILEQQLVKRWLGEPVEALLRHKSKPELSHLIFRGYFRSLPSTTQERVKEQALKRKCSAQGAGLFLHCYATATSENDKLQGRLDDFRNQYGFARNMSLSFILIALLLTISAAQRHDIQYRYCLASLALAVGMLYRYLKFYRQYSYELLVRYAELTPKQKED